LTIQKLSKKLGKLQKMADKQGTGAIDWEQKYRE